MVCVWDAGGDQEALTLGSFVGGLLGVTFSPDGSRLASAGEGSTGPGQLRLWGVASGAELFGREPGWLIVWDVAFSPDGTRLATAGHDRMVRVWDAATGDALLALQGHGNGPVLAVVFSPAGSRLASAGTDATVRLWDATALPADSPGGSRSPMLGTLPGSGSVTGPA